jgi:hypothetical protein
VFLYYVNESDYADTIINSIFFICISVIVFAFIKKYKFQKRNNIKISKFALTSVAVAAFLVTSANAFDPSKLLEQLGGVATKYGNHIKTDAKPLTYADLQSGKYKLSLKSGWDRNANGIHFVTGEIDGIKYVNVNITKRLAQELSQRKDFADYVGEAIEGGNAYVLSAPEHNLDGIRIKDYQKANYRNKNGDIIKTSTQAYIPMDIADTNCNGVLEKHDDGYSYCLADDLGDVFTKRSLF